MALMNPTADFGASDPGADDTEYDAAVKSGDIRNVMAVLEKQYRLPAGYLAKTAQVESRMNPNAQNPRSSAGGLFQFIDSTAKRYGLTDKMDPVQSTLAAAQLAGDNADYLGSKLGRDPTTPELYAAHQQGAGGAAKILAQPDAMMSDLVGDRAARLNGAGNLTGGQFIDRFAAKLGEPAVARSVSTAATPEADMPAAGAQDASFMSGLMNKPPEAYQAAKDDEHPFLNGNMRNIIMAMGMSMMGGKKGDYLGRFGENYLPLQAADSKAADRRYDMWKDQRNFGQTLSESQRAQANTEAARALQERGLNNSEASTKFSQDLQAKADARAEKSADAPKIMTRPDGSVVAIPDEGAPVERLPAIRTLNEVDRRTQDAARFGLTGPERANYILTGKYEPQNGGANPYANPGGGKTTGEQDKSSGFADRMFQNEAVIRKNEALGTGRFERGAASIPGIGSMLTSDAYKSQDTAKRNWMAAQLRKESGAAIGQDEYTQADQQYFPQPGDSPEIIAQKRSLRQTATEGMARDGGPGYVPKMVFDQKGELQPYKRPSASAPPSSAAGPTRAELEAEARRRGLIQ